MFDFEDQYCYRTIEPKFQQNEAVFKLMKTVIKNIKN